MSTVISVENVSKQYRLGEVGTGSLAHDVNRWWHRVRGKEDPYLKVGDTNDRSTKGSSDYSWALRDVSFEVKQGEVLGIIGRNGAGKSTLLKILSRVTRPTTGEIKVKGRIASLLEVGTGFHPELTGRENIFLNGAILGMRKAEIARKFDEIVEFSGCERYIDTPVKRYSSGMYVRLAFAVAAHLDPEILIVDEVLAVGDAEFQKKCLGKMKDVAGEGRTVLFVSHNMRAIHHLCSHAILLYQGSKVYGGLPHCVIEAYHESFHKSRLIDSDIKSSASIVSASIEDSATGSPVLITGEDVIVTIAYNGPSDASPMGIGVILHSEDVNCRVFAVLSSRVGITDDRGPGKRQAVLRFPNIRLLPGRYSITVTLNGESEEYDRSEKICYFEISGISPRWQRAIPLSGSHGLVYLETNWILE